MGKIPGKILFDKRVVGDEGSVLGILKDIVFDEQTGKLVSIEVEPFENSILMREGVKRVLIPYRVVKSIKDIVVLYESELQNAPIRVVE